MQTLNYGLSSVCPHRDVSRSGRKVWQPRHAIHSGQDDSAYTVPAVVNQTSSYGGKNIFSLREFLAIFFLSSCLTPAPHRELGKTRLLGDRRKTTLAGEISRDALAIHKMPDRNFCPRSKPSDDGADRRAPKSAELTFHKSARLGCVLHRYSSR